jgi:hypothetical protein
MFNIGALMRLAGRMRATSLAIELLRTAPRSAEEWNQEAASSLFGRMLIDAHRFKLLVDEKLFGAMLDYFKDHLTVRAPPRRAMLEATVAGVLGGYGSGV